MPSPADFTPNPTWVDSHKLEDFPKQTGRFGVLIRDSRECSREPPKTKPMKKIALFSSTLLAALGLTLHAEDTKISGEAVCAKCNLKEATACQMAIKVKTADGKEETILADNNKVAKDFHKEICKKSENVNAEGTITEKDGKKTIALTKDEKAQ